MIILELLIEGRRDKKLIRKFNPLPDLFEIINIGYIFSLLDLIVEMSRVTEEPCNKETLRRILLDDYKREQATIESIERMKKVAQKNMENIVADYNTYFNEDIEIDVKTQEVQTSSARIKSKTSTEIIDFGDMEKGRNVIGVRSKYYLEYGSTIQYFKNNYARNQKMKSIEHKEQNVILTIKS